MNQFLSSPYDNPYDLLVSLASRTSGSTVMKQYLAERYLRGISADGQTSLIEIRIGQPEEISEKTWTVDIDIKGLEYGMKTALGVDPWQALTVAFAVTEQAVRYFLEAGGKLCDINDESELPVEELFPRFAA